MADREVTRLVYTLQEEIGDLRKQVKTLQSAPALRNASIEDTSIPVVDRDGNITSVIGRQSDGSSGVSVRRSPFQPMPTAPILEAGEQAGTCAVEWDGGTHFGDAVPIIFGKIEIYAVLLGEGEEPFTAPNPGAERVGSIRERAGGEVLVALPNVGTWAVWLRMVGADGQTTGLWSPAATVEISGKVDVDAIHERIDTERDRITEADTRLTSGQSQLEANLGDLDDRKAERQELTDGLAGANTHAESVADDARVMAVSEAAADAQVEYDRLQAAADRALRAQPNFFKDGGFDDPQMVDWRVADASYRQTTGGRTSEPSYLVSSDRSINANLLSQFRPAKEGQTLYIEAYVKRVGTESSNHTVRIIVQVRDTSGATGLMTLATMSGHEIAENQWSRIAVNFEIPEATTGVSAGIRVPPGPSAAYRWDDLRAVDISEFAPTIKEAELARLRAEEAHLAAGEAHDLAASAYDTASQKNTIHWGTGTPAGTGSDGDVWWQYEVRNGRRVVIGTWHYAGGVWEQDELAEEYLPLVNIGTGTYGDLSGQRLIADSVTSNVVDTEEFFAAQAVIEKIWTDIVRSRLIESEGIITEDMIATGAITTPKLTVTEEMAAEVVRVMRLEGDEMAFNYIRGMLIQAAQIEGSVFLAEDAQGNATVRLDGMDNFIRGSLHAGVADQAEIHLDYGQRTITSGDDEDGEPEVIATFDTPYIEFRDGSDYVVRPAISLSEDGHLIISPGRTTDTPRYRAPLNVTGDVHVNRVDAREQLRTRNGLRVLTGTVSQPGGIMRDGTRTRFQGRAAADHGPHDRIVEGSIGPFELDPGAATRGTHTYGAPSETGIRRPIASVHVANTSWGFDSWRTAIVSTAAAGASSFRWILRSNSANAGTVQCWVYYSNPWI